VEKRSPRSSAGDTWPSDGMATDVCGCWILTHRVGDDDSYYLFGLFETRKCGVELGLMLAEVSVNHVSFNRKHI
jgi:hypothetical protein